MAATIIIWLQALATWPALLSPTWTMRRPRAFEERPHPFQHRGVAPGHDGEGGVDGPFSSAGDQGVDHGDAFGGQGDGNAPGDIGGDGRTIDQHQTGAMPSPSPSVPRATASTSALAVMTVNTTAQRRLYSAGVAQRPPPGRRRGAAVCGRRAQTRQFMPRLEVERHRAPHDAKADEANFSFCTLDAESRKYRNRRAIHDSNRSDRAP